MLEGRNRKRPGRTSSLKAIPSRLDRRITLALDYIGRAFQRLLWREGIERDVTPLQIRILTYLAEHEKEIPGITALARAFACTKPTVSDAVAALVRKGYLQRMAHPRDKRRRILVLTPEGKRMARELGQWTLGIQQVCRELEARDQAGFWVLLAEMLTRMAREGILPDVRICTTCRYFLLGTNEKATAAGHRCTRMNRALSVLDIRLDCPEYRAA